jgi:hypothetical protein
MVVHIVKEAWDRGMIWHRITYPTKWFKLKVRKFHQNLEFMDFLILLPFTKMVRKQNQMEKRVQRRKSKEV